MSFVSAALILGGAAAAGEVGSAAIGAASNGGKPNIQDVYTPGPDAEIGQAGAQTWATQLQQMAGEPDYGAIQPDWSDIWNQTQQQVQNYFTGTATNPGINDQIDASFAQRGMNGDPAASFLESQSGANEAQDLGNLSAQENIAKNQFGLEGQQNWMTDMQNFQNSTMQAQGNWSGAVVSPTSTQQIADAAGAGIGGVATLGANAISGQQQDAYLQSLLNPSAAASYASPTGFSDITMPTTV